MSRDRRSAGQRRAAKLKNRQRRLAKQDARLDLRSPGGEAGFGEHLVGKVVEVLQEVVAVTLSERSAEPARKFVATVAELDGGLMEATGADGPPVFGATLVLLIDWLVTVRRKYAEPTMPAKLLARVRADLGVEPETAVGMVIGLLDETADMESVVERALDELDHDFVPALIWLLAAVVAEYGDGEVTWLEQFLENFIAPDVDSGMPAR